MESFFLGGTTNTADGLDRVTNDILNANNGDRTNIDNAVITVTGKECDLI